jgi:hypothetical protein
MMSTSEKFEKQIHRIHELIEQEESEVNWNDKIPDPDNLSQARQIDISIKRDGKLTLIECRIHRKAQDVKWIEELIGRRLSLRADAIIAVSNSGFTEGAKLKAKQYGVILRDLQGLTEQEIQEWGHSTHIWLTFFEYMNVEINLVIDPEDGKIPYIDDIIADLERTNTLYQIFEMASDAIEQKNQTSQCRFKGQFKVEGLSVCEMHISEIGFSAGIRRITKNLQVPSVIAYDAPHVKNTERSVLIEKVAFGDFEITQSSNRVFVAVDLTPVKCPANSQFKGINFDFGREVSMEALEIIGLPQFMIPIEEIKIGLTTATRDGVCNPIPKV